MMIQKAALAITGAIACMALAPNTIAQQGDPIGSEEYRVCMACHGTQGKGDGPMRDMLPTKPADLTMLKANNGGAFPYERALQVIDGRDPLAAHGSKDMPIWGSRYTSQYAGPGGPLGAEMEARARILSLVYYLESIQAP